MCKNDAVRSPVAVLAALMTAAGSIATAPLASAGPQTCNDAFCTPGIRPGAVLGAPCDNTAYYVFGVDNRNDWGRLVFCGSPRRYEPRYFRSPSMFGVKEENSICLGYENGVAQAPDGLFLTCNVRNGETRWERGDA